MSIRGPIRALAGFLAVMAIATSFVSMAMADSPIDNEAREIAAALACPVCQGQSVADSSAPLARQMQDLIRVKLAQGETRQQILQYFVDRYGEAILREPPKSGFNQILWWFPTLALVGGIGLLALVLFRLKDRHAAAPSSSEVAIPDELAAYESQLQKEIERVTTRTKRPS